MGAKEYREMRGGEAIGRHLAPGMALNTARVNDCGPRAGAGRRMRGRTLGLPTVFCLALAACGATPTVSESARPVDKAGPDPSRAAEAPRPSEPGETAWFELTLQVTGVPTAGPGDQIAGVHEGHVFRAGTLDNGQSARLELPADHAFADGPRNGLVLVGSDDGRASDVQLVSAPDGEATSVLATDELVWGATLTPDGSAVYYVPVDRASMTDVGLWRLDVSGDGQAEQVIQVFAEGEYDFASQIRFEWSPAGTLLVAQYCNRRICHAHLIDVGRAASRLHEDPAVFELRGVTDTEYIADLSRNAERSGIVAVDLETLDVRVLADEWGTSEVHDTSDGPVVVYFAPPDHPRDVVLIGLPLEGEPDPFLAYRVRGSDAPVEHFLKPLGAAYQAPDGWMLLWPGTPSRPGDPAAVEATFLLFELLGGQHQTYPYEADAPR